MWFALSRRISGTSRPIVSPRNVEGTILIADDLNFSRYPRPSRPRNLVQRLDSGSRAADAHEQSRSRRGRKARRADRLWWHWARRAGLAVLPRHRAMLARARKR